MKRVIRSHSLGPAVLPWAANVSPAPSTTRPSIISRCGMPLSAASPDAHAPTRIHASFDQTRALSYLASKNACYKCLQPSQRLTRQQQQRGVQDFLSKYTRPHEYSHGQNRVQVTAAESSWLSVNDIISRRSVLLFPTSFMLWKARLPADISSSSLALMKVVFPTLEMLVIGCGRSIHEVDREVRLAIAEEFRVHGTVVEFMDTKSAVSTFNVMNAEDRQVGAALLLPEPGPNEDDRIDLQALFADSEEPAGRSPSPSAPPSSLPSSAAPPPDPAAEASQSSKEGEGSRPAQYRKHKEIFSDSNK